MRSGGFEYKSRRVVRFKRREGAPKEITAVLSPKHEDIVPESTEHNRKFSAVGKTTVP